MPFDPSQTGFGARTGASFGPQPASRVRDSEQGDGSDARTEGFGAAPPSINLPKGGGATRGVGEKFGVNPATGTGSLIVPLPASPGRSGFGPKLSLAYDSGAGNGPFGFGWSLAIPSITRKTDKGLPRYRDAEESDVFILSDAEDLVPVLKAGPEWPLQFAFGQQWKVHRYRPRIEGLFARIEHWRAPDGSESHWRVVTRDNVTSLYGRTAGARIHDPADPSRIFRWLLEQTHDDKGNVIVYEYKEENSQGVDVLQVNERNRTDKARSANRYLKSIRYGNKAPYQPGPTPFEVTFPNSPKDWLFEVLFDYGEHVEPLPVDADGREFVHATVSEQRPWTAREDAFSTYRAAFEIRTYRLCQRVLMFHHFADEKDVGENCLVRSIDFHYAQDAVASFVTSVTQCGYRRSASADTFYRRSLPPIEFAYSQIELHDTVYAVDNESLQNLPIGLGDTDYQWVDLDGEGLSGILSEQAGAWFYKRNLSPTNMVTENGLPHVAPRFGVVEQVASEPALGLAGGRAQFMDLVGDGQLDLVTLERPVAGFYERTEEQGWERFTAFKSLPDIVWNDPNLRFLDLTGDGHTDALITEDDVLTWYPSLAEDGFGPAERVRSPLDEENGPRVVFADGTQSIFLADMSGDGLTDLVRIRNGEVSYWPNLGYGRFGAKVTMDQAPWFEAPDLFDQRRIRLGDIDGSGTIDIFYLGTDGVAIYRNRSGNSWAGKELLASFPPTTDLTSVKVVDLLGNGTACLVWSSPLAADARAPMRYIDLMGGRKPHLLVASRNNLGAETQVQYASSTKFYVQDRRVGKPWITRLPFPVHVVERSETYDRISRNRFVSRYVYHHGYFDGVEREFRGFAMVEQWDTEEFAALTGSSAFPAGDNVEASSHVPPVLTRTWFHTGVYLGRQGVSNFFAGLIDTSDIGEYYREPGLSDEQAKKLLLDDTVLPDGLTVEEEREACRALKGSMLRQEVYALDGTDKQEHPYAVTEQNFAISVVQPQGENRHCVFFTHPLESISYHYQRDPADPRIQHALTLQVDEFGNLLKSAAIGYGRRKTIRVLDNQGQITEVPNPDLNKLELRDREKQIQTLVTYTENRVTNSIDAASDYRTPLLAETRTYELTGYEPKDPTGRFQASDFVKPDPNDAKSLTHDFDGEIEYEQQPTTGRQRRLIEHQRTYYRGNDLAGRLPLVELQSLALPFESYKLAFTPGLLAQVFKRNSEALLPDPADVLGGQGADRGGYVDLDGNGRWWIASGRVFLSPDSNDTAAQELAHAREHYFLPCRYRDPFHSDTVSTENFITYDNYDLLLLETRDALGNRVTVGERLPSDDLDPTKRGNDYRVLQPRLVMDPNRNRSEVAFDALGMVVGTAVMGKPAPAPVEGDALDEFRADLTQAEIDQFLTDPRGSIAATLLNKATTRIIYDLTAYSRELDPSKRPAAVAATLVRETHASEPAAAGGLRIQASLSYSDGFGREIQKKIQAEPGPVPKRDANGKIVIGVDGQPEMTDGDVSPRWVAGGWTIFNNKGKPVRQYEPFFTDTHRFEFDVRIGVSPVLFYDPVERVVATLHPNNTFAKVVFDPWRQTTYDVNDTVAPRNAQTGDPRTDPDIAGYVAEYFKALPVVPGQPWQTWYQQRQAGGLGPHEQAAADKAAAHADTPSIAHLDVLGRPFLTMAQNRVVCANHPLDGTEGQFATRVDLDIKGNQRAVIDAKDRVVMRYDYDMLGNPMHQLSMEAGARWLLNDVAGKTIRVWDSRGFLRRMTYDELRRLIGLFVTENGAERLAERTVYGESQGTANNHRTRVFQVFDGAGLVTYVANDFKGNLLQSQRQLLPDYKNAVDWQQNPTAGDGTFTSSTTYDALNRPLAVTAPDGSVYRPTFNEANLLDKIDVNLRGAAAATAFVADIDYNPKGQRTLIRYANSTLTTYAYDQQTFRLIRLKTTRDPGLNGLAAQIFVNPTVVQDLRYTYDPAGNITRIEDAALKTIIHDGQTVEPACGYVYDALYRLIEARGREHIGQTAFQTGPASDNFRDHPFVGAAHANDLQALRTYTERYVYDEVGNFEQWIHHFADGGWTRGYGYGEASLIEPAKKSNRLSHTTLGQATETYAYDAHGNMLAMPHLAAMTWDFEDQLQHVDLGGGGRAYYVYDAGGQRVRKVIERQNGTRQKERLYLGGFEVYREFDGSGTNIDLQRETLHVMDDKQRIALVETKTVDAQSPVATPQSLTRYQIGNHLGSASLELDDAGQLISYEEYHPYGTTSYQVMRTGAEVSAKRYRYTGKERDEETGFSYHGARYYAPWLSRWTRCDPAGLKGGANSYAYVSGRPLVLADEDGRQGEPLWLIQQRRLEIRPVATRAGRGITDLQRSALRGMNHAFGPGPRTRLHWGHPEGQSFVTQPGGTSVPLRAETEEENLRKSNVSKVEKKVAEAEGKVVRTKDIDPTVPEGTHFKRPPPEPFESVFAEYEAAVEAPKRAKFLPPGEHFQLSLPFPKPAKPSAGAWNQLSLKVLAGPKIAAPGPAPDAPIPIKVHGKQPPKPEIRPRGTPTGSTVAADAGAGGIGAIRGAVQKVGTGLGLVQIVTAPTPEESWEAAGWLAYSGAFYAAPLAVGAATVGVLLTDPFDQTIKQGPTTGQSNEYQGQR